MSIERAALDHNCNVIRRQVQDEFPALTLLFVVHKDGNKEQAVNQETARLRAWPSGEKIPGLFRACAGKGKDGFLGLFHTEKKGFMGLNRRPHYYGLFFVNTDHYDTMESAQSDLYHLAWHAIDLFENHARGYGHTRYEVNGDFIESRQTPSVLSISNLMADVFTAILLALIENDRKQIRRLAQKRAGLTLSPALHYRAELYPFPVALETTELVYEDLKDTLDPKLKIYRRALQLAHEVRLTHDEQSIKQWWAFSTRAQEMAWMGCDAQTILNAAIYTSEDPYVKATAYLTAEAMNIEPEMFTDAGSYNPFTENEVNERAHKKLCEKLFRQVTDRVRAAGDPYYFLEEAQHQNNKLKEGHIAGWCAHAMLSLAQAWETAGPDGPENAHALFRDKCEALPWENLRKLAKIMVKQRRAGGEINTKKLHEIAGKEAGLLPVARAFEATEGREFRPLKENDSPKSAARPAYSQHMHDDELPPILAHLKDEET